MIFLELYILQITFCIHVQNCPASNQKMYQVYKNMMFLNGLAILTNIVCPTWGSFDSACSLVSSSLNFSNISCLASTFTSTQANFACCMLDCHFHLVDLSAVETGKKYDQAPNTDVGKTMLAVIVRT